MSDKEELPKMYSNQKGTNLLISNNDSSEKACTYESENERQMVGSRRNNESFEDMSYEEAACSVK